MFLAGRSVLQAQQFKEIGLQSKLSEVSNNNGVAVADYDNDGDLDVFAVTRWDGQNPASSQLFQNNNDGTFTNVTTQSGIQSTHDYSVNRPQSPHPFGEKMGASWGDFNNDGYADLFLTNSIYLELYLNNGDGTFTDVTTEMGIIDTNECINVVGLWFDYNNDSFLDLYVSGVITVSSCRGKLYRNNGGTSFTEVSEEAGVKDSGRSAWTAIPLDVNEDGHQDFYIANDFGASNELYVNDGTGYFVDQAEAYGVSDKFMDGMGVAYADYDNDGSLDLYVTNINESSLFRNSGGVFQNVSKEVDVFLTGWGWGCGFADFDHDLDMDLVVANGYYNNDQDRYYENTLETGRMMFLDHSEQSAFGKSSISNGLTVFDYDNDGDLDVLIGRTAGALGFYENQVISGGNEGGQNWVKIDLEGVKSNRDAIGTLVTLQAGGKMYKRYYQGAGLMMQNQIPVHFGLANIESIDEVVIAWTSGIIDRYDDVPVNSFIHVTEGIGYQTLSLSSDKISGCTDPNSCNYEVTATFDDGSCEYLKSNPISGRVLVGPLSTFTYSYPKVQGNDYQWTVSNGHILHGQGTESITVQWGIGQYGQVAVTEKGKCYSQEIALDVAIVSDEVDYDVSVARLWNEALLSAIRVDFARPTVHARNLFHASIVMYDAWAIISGGADPYLIGKQLYNYNNSFDGFESLIEKGEALDIAISYAAYRLLTYRFRHSPNQKVTQDRFDELMLLLGYDPYNNFSDYRGGDPAALGNFIAQSMIEYGLIDGANESNQYSNEYYQPVNAPLVPVLPGNPTIENPNRWQPLQFQVFIDQAGNPISGNTPSFLSPEWGNVKPFSLREESATHYSRNGNEYIVYHDPGTPPKINQAKMASSDVDVYKWNFSLVAIWSSHLDPSDGVMWDISPRGIGSVDFHDLPSELSDYEGFYDLFEGGDIGQGRSVNPVTGQAYQPQIVARGDYARVLAEFWADGPDSETPPGHWFTILNYVHDHPDFERKFKGQDGVINPLEWDVKAYFTLGGAMHDAAIASWGVKGWYDFIRPISAIRYMADQGQCTDPSLDNYHSDGIPLIEGYIEVVKVGDPLAGHENQHVGKIKLFAWKGHDYIDDPEKDEARVDWILAENWWPYQRPSFVTPPFAGYVSGHSTYSRAAAEVLTRLTGSDYFPGGMGEFTAKKNKFLVFEEGPSQDVVLQWATYRDASDQCSLSRIWGGIHPPADDLSGRMMGGRIGRDAFALAEKYFNGNGLSVKVKHNVYPVPSHSHEVYITNTSMGEQFFAYDLQGNQIPVRKTGFNDITGITSISFDTTNPGIYFLKSDSGAWKVLLQ
ncbi:Repeat domain-containing protein [Reichenbachiella agariperforans]|uniref:Repeat domain-containing protein n=1 Tax=Reichenbachiella agariperforans TaxID=156994 RepID=A0A1M6KCK2_REIAG|nr:Repeat domain-containing protein [Reichenbachiella agariperforans]